MNVASRELCEELYKLTGWKDNPLWHYRGENSWFIALERPAVDNLIGAGCWPAYDLDYLLRKLPRSGIRFDDVRNEWVARADVLSRPRLEWADSPENAACKLAITLANQGLLPNLNGDKDHG